MEAISAAASCFTNTGFENWTVNGAKQIATTTRLIVDMGMNMRLGVFEGELLAVAWFCKLQLQEMSLH